MKASTNEASLRHHPQSRRLCAPQYGKSWRIWATRLRTSRFDLTEPMDHPTAYRHYFLPTDLIFNSRCFFVIWALPLQTTTKGLIKLGLELFHRIKAAFFRIIWKIQLYPWPPLTVIPKYPRPFVKPILYCGFALIFSKNWTPRSVKRPFKLPVQ